MSYYQKFSVTYKADAPGGYAGTHHFFTMAARTSFIEHAVKRGIGKEWIEARSTKP